MKKLSLLAWLVVGFAATMFGQKTVTGLVTDVQGEPLIGASILVLSTSVGTVTDVDGTFSITLPAGSDVLQVSYTGFETQEISVGAQTNLTVTMAEGITLSEAVVTALGISREKKSLSYSAQEIKNDQLNISRSAGFVDALSGKVAGVQLVGSPSSGFREGNIRIRGVGGLTGTDPLYVLDGTPVDAGAINMDNVESVSVLKGPAATALYGNRASGGVVVVTSKKGKRGSGVGIDINSSSTFDNVSLLPAYQNEYAGGYSQDFIKFKYNPSVHPSEWAAFEGQNLLDYSGDESWGPKMDGSLYRPYYSWFDGSDFGVQKPLNPQPDNVKDFFQTGKTLNNNIAFSGGGENYNFRFNYNNIIRNLVLPNTSQDRNIVSVIGNFDLNKRLTVGANINYKKTNQQGNIIEGYGGGLTGSFNQWFQRQIEIDRLRDYKNPDGTFNSWNIKSPTSTSPLYWDNPFYDIYENVPHYKEDRTYGDVSLTYKVTDKLKVQGFIRSDIKDFSGDQRITEGGLNVPLFRTYEGNETENNYEALISYADRNETISYDFNVGGNIRTDEITVLDARTVGGLAIPGYYHLSSSRDKPLIDSRQYDKEVRSVYGRASFGYKDFLYLEGSIRNDWSSALPKDNNSYLYPMVGVSFVFSELLGNQNLISNGKVRYSFAQVGSDLPPHEINPVYSAPNASFYGSLPAMFVPSTLRNAELRPQLTSTHEAGLEMKFFNNRLGFDLTYYTDINEDQILRLSVPSSSGYAEAIINAGKITREGVELALTATPIQTSDFNWDISVNFANNRSFVEELAEGLNNRVIGGTGFEGGPFWGGISLNAKVGEEWGTIIGRKFRRDDNGNPLVDEDGYYLFDANQSLGSILPKFTGGIYNVFEYKGVRMAASFDFQSGGQYYSVSGMFNAYSGLSAETVGNNDKGNPKRDDPSAGGGVRADAYFENGQPNDVYLSADEYYKSLFGLHENWIFDASYFKLRELSLGYNFNPKKLGLNFANRLTVSVVGRNLLFFAPSKERGFDPSELERYWYEGGQLPQTRGLGFNVSLGF